MDVVSVHSAAGSLLLPGVWPRLDARPRHRDLPVRPRLRGLAELRRLGQSKDGSGSVGSADRITAHGAVSQFSPHLRLVAPLLAAVADQPAETVERLLAVGAVVCAAIEHHAGKILPGW